MLLLLATSYIFDFISSISSGYIIVSKVDVQPFHKHFKAWGTVRICSILHLSLGLLQSPLSLPASIFLSLFSPCSSIYNVQQILHISYIMEPLKSWFAYCFKNNANKNRLKSIANSILNNKGSTELWILW